MRAVLLAACVVGSSTVARAELIACTEDTCACTSGARIVLVRNDGDGPVCAPSPPALVADHARWEGAVDADAGWLGTALAPALGFDLAAGVRFDRLALLAEYRLLALQPDTTIAARSTLPMVASPGTLQRLGVVARYSVVATPAHALWIEAGVGEQLIHTTSNEVARPDLDVGLGCSLGRRGPQHHGAAFVALRAMLARAAGATLSIDPGVLLSAGFAFGS